MNSSDTIPQTELDQTELVQSAEEPLRWSLTRWLAFWIALFATSLPMMVVYLLNMWHLEHYRFFPFVFAAVAGMLWTRVSLPICGPAGAWAWAAIFAATAAILCAAWLDSPWFAAISFVLVAIAFFGSQADIDGRSLSHLAVPLLLLVRLPLNWDRLLVVRLQGVTTELASVVMDLVRLPHTAEANVIKVPGRELFVAEACSGIQSVFTLAFLACLAIAFYRRRVWLLPVYLCVAILLAVAGNVLRVSSVAIAAVWFDADLASGWPHELLGYVTLLIAIFFLWSFDHLVVAMLHRVSMTDRNSVRNPFRRLWNWIVAGDPLFLVSAVSGYADGSQKSIGRRRFGKNAEPFWGNHPLQHAFFGCATAVTIVSVTAALNVQPIGYGGFMTDEILVDPREDLVASSARHLKVTEHRESRDSENPRLGKNADIWDCEIDGYQGQMVLSQTYLGWHELCICYEIAKWKQIKREVEHGDRANSEIGSVPIAVARLRRSPSQEGYLFYTAIDREGRFVDPPPLPGVVGTRLQNAGSQSRDPMVMLQLWVTAPEKIPPQTITRMRDDFFRIRDTMAVEIRQYQAGARGTPSTDGHGDDPNNAPPPLNDQEAS